MDGIHHGTRQGDTENEPRVSKGISPPFGGKGITNLRDQVYLLLQG